MMLRATKIGFGLLLVFGFRHGAAENETTILSRNRQVVLAVWTDRVAARGGVALWSPAAAGMEVFQEWMALLTVARDSGTSAQSRRGKALEHYVVGNAILPLGHPGTTLPVPGASEGDFDMIALQAVSLVELFQDNRRLLTDRTYIYLVRDLIRTFGQVPQATFDVAFLRFPETENHLFMMESNRLLMNELVRDNPRRLRAIAALRDSLAAAGVVIDAGHGGQDAFLLRRMQLVLTRGFFEFNAKIYQRFTTQALDNLYSFARDSTVAAGAGCALDNLSTVFALQSIASIRYGPYRRSSETFDDSTLVGRDAICSFFAVQTGIFAWSSDPRDGYWSDHLAHGSVALFSALLRYRVPAPIWRWMRNRPDIYEAEIRSGYAASARAPPITEHYSGGPHDLLSAGGRHEDAPGANFPTLRDWPQRSPWVYDIIARPASLLLFPVARLEDAGDIIHTRTGWDGDQLALHRRFFYAYAPAESFKGQEWPFSVPAEFCREHDDFATSVFRFRICAEPDLGVYLVFSKVKVLTGEWLWKRQHYVRGGLEVLPSAAAASLEALSAKVATQNEDRTRSGLRGHREYLYTTWDGVRLDLNPHYRPGVRPFLSVRDTLDSVFDAKAGGPEWPRKWGDPILLQARLLDRPQWLAAVKDGRLRFRDPETGDAWVSDFQEWWKPMRRLESH